MRWIWLSAPVMWGLTACSGDVEDPTGLDEQELITTVVLTFTPDAGGPPLTFAWADPEAAGDPTIDPIVLPDASSDGMHAPATYQLEVQFLNELEDPAEDITEEVADESDEHQVFVFGSGVEGPGTGPNDQAVVTHAYNDSDAGGLPLGLDNTLSTVALGSGELRLVLQHLPPEDDSAVKVEGLADDLATGGPGALPGDADVDVVFPITVE